MKPRMFIGSSVEQLALAYAAQENLEHDVDATVWSQGVFNISRGGMESLLDELNESDFGLFVFAPDDVVNMRDETKRTVRDNVIFELGMFIGRLGKERCFILVPQGEELHLPTDLTGMAPAEYSTDRISDNALAALGSACNRVRRAIRNVGFHKPEEPAARSVLPPQAIAVTPTEEYVPIYDDNADCVTMIEAYLNNQDDIVDINFDSLDRELRLRLGASKELLAFAVDRHGFVLVRSGQKAASVQRS